MLEFPARLDLFVLVLANEPVTGHGLEVRDVTDLRIFRQVRSTAKKPSNKNLLATFERIPPMSTVENPVELELEREPHDRSAFAEAAARKTIGPGGLQEQLLQSDAAAEASLGRFERLVVEEVFDAFEFGGQEAGRLEHGAVDRLVVDCTAGAVGRLSAAPRVRSASRPSPRESRGPRSGGVPPRRGDARRRSAPTRPRPPGGFCPPR